MIDSPEERRRKNAAQFEQAKEDLTKIGKLFVLHLAAELIDTTPGPNLQEPYDTEYEATGRLRNAWAYETTLRSTATRWGVKGDGPWSEHGEVAYAAIAAEVWAQPLHRVAYLQNDVAYGYLVHEGRGRHKNARPWAKLVAANQHVYADRARQEAMGL